jgi:glycosyltransferase involved in cell wall biosynthesis
LRIVHLNTNATYGGAAIAGHRISDALALSGHSSIFLSSGNYSRLDQKRITFNFALEKIRFIFSEKDRSVRFKFSPGWYGLDKLALGEIEKADVIHLHWVNHGLASIDFFEKLKKLNKPIVWTLHDMWAFTGGCFHSQDCNHFQQSCGDCFYLKTPSKTDLSSQIFGKKSVAYKNLKLNVATCSQWLADKALSSALFRNFPIHVVPNPIDSGFFTPVNKIATRAKLGLKSDALVILFAAVSIRDTRKGYGILRKALILWMKKNPSVIKSLELVILGDTKGIKDELQFDCSITSVGYVSDPRTMAEYYNAADFYAMPSLDENLPNTIMESLSCGTPVLAFATGGIPEMIKHKETGYLAERGNVEALTQGLDWMTEHCRKESVIVAARNHILQNYNYALIAAKYTEIYQSALND